MIWSGGVLVIGLPFALSRQRIATIDQGRPTNSHAVEFCVSTHSTSTWFLDRRYQQEAKRNTCAKVLRVSRRLGYTCLLLSVG